MFKILLFAVLVTLIIIVSARYKKMDATQQRKTLWRVAIGVFLGLLIMLVITGRMHWVGAAIGALLPFLRPAFGLLMQLLPHWLQRKKAEQNHRQTPPATPTSAMTLEEALGILGLAGDINQGQITRAMVLDAHRHLIQKLHPDRGGNDYLAAKINQARDLLINHLNTQE